MPRGRGYSQGGTRGSGRIGRHPEAVVGSTGSRPLGLTRRRSVGRHGEPAARQARSFRRPAPRHVDPARLSPAERDPRSPVRYYYHAVRIRRSLGAGEAMEMVEGTDAARDQPAMRRTGEISLELSSDAFSPDTEMRRGFLLEGSDLSFQPAASARRSEPDSSPRTAGRRSDIDRQPVGHVFIGRLLPRETVAVQGHHVLKRRAWVR